MSDTSSKIVPIPSVQRLPIYLRFLKEKRDEGERVVSCTQIAEEFCQLSVQVRKDLSITNISGRPKVGYRIDELIDAIESFLGWNRKTTAFLIGAGNLGSAILKYEGFVEHGLDIIAAFDVDPALFGKTINNRPVYPLCELVERAQNQKIDLGVITAPASVAQSVANLLVQIGVRAIWNYAPTRLETPPNVVCEEVKLSASFAVLSCRLYQHNEIQRKNVKTPKKLNVATRQTPDSSNVSDKSKRPTRRKTF